MKTQLFFKTLFPNETAHTNLTDTLYDTSVLPVHSTVEAKSFERFCVNELHPNTDLNPTDPKKHRADLPRRADCNVICFRNILVEVDKMTIEEQIQWLTHYKLPLTAIVHSGKKSLHVLISLKEPCKDIQEYSTLVDSLYNTIKSMGLKIDENCANPSRLSRFPNALRSDTAKIQELLALGSHIDKTQLTAWIEQHKPAYVIQNERNDRRMQREHQARLDEAINLDAVCFAAELPNPRVDFDESSERFISRKTRALAERFEYETESRHEAFKTAVTQMTKAGFNSDEIERYLEDAVSKLVPDRPNELRTLLAWAERNVVADEITHLKSV